MHLQDPSHELLAAVRQRHHRPHHRTGYGPVDLLPETRGAVPTLVVFRTSAPVASLIPPLGMHDTTADAAHEDRGEHAAGVSRLARERMISAGGPLLARATPVDGGVRLIPDVIAHNPQMGNLPGEHRVGTIPHQLRTTCRQLLLADFLAIDLLPPVVQPADELNHVGGRPCRLLAVGPLGEPDRREPLRDRPGGLATGHAVEYFADHHRQRLVHLVVIGPICR